MFFLSLCMVRSDVLKYAEDALFTHLFVTGAEYRGLNTPTHKEQTSKNINQHSSHVYNLYFPDKMML